MVIPPEVTQKRGLPGIHAKGRPLRGVCYKKFGKMSCKGRASARGPGFLPEIVKSIAEIRGFCQVKLQNAQKAEHFRRILPGDVHFAEKT
jgi:hypothetical protein